MRLRAVRFAWLIRVVLAVVLAVAILSKIAHAKELLAGNSLLSNYWVLSVGVAVEVFVFSILLVGNSTTAWWASVMLFGALAPIAGWAWWTRVDCGCFGSDKWSWLSFPIDIAALVALGFTRSWWIFQSSDAISVTPARDMVDPKLFHQGVSQLNSPEEADRYSFFRSQWRVFLCIIASLISIGVLQRSITGKSGNAEMAYLLADDLIGNEWPVGGSHSESLAELMEGKWLVLVVRADCDHCRKLMNDFDTVDLTVLPFRVVTMVAGNLTWAIHKDRLSLERDSPEKITWTSAEPFIASPAAFLLDNGKVVSASDGEEADTFVLDLLKPISENP